MENWLMLYQIISLKKHSIVYKTSNDSLDEKKSKMLLANDIKYIVYKSLYELLIVCNIFDN